jgi:hypothetical protein
MKISVWLQQMFAIVFVVQIGGHSSAFITVRVATARIGLARCDRK